MIILKKIYGTSLRQDFNNSLEKKPATKGRPAGSKNKIPEDQTSLYSAFATVENTNPLEVVEASKGAADEEGERQGKPEFIEEEESVFNPKAKSPIKTELRSGTVLESPKMSTIKKKT